MKRFGFLVVGVVTAVAALSLGGRLWTAAEMSLSHVALIKSQAEGGTLRAGDETTWEAGWQRSCQSGNSGGSLAGLTLNPATLTNVAQTQIERGAYDAALTALNQAAEAGWIDQAVNAAAYRAALKMQWSEAARLYQLEQTPRLNHWWGTVFYLAAQERMFAGDVAGAAPFYQQADKLYDTSGPYLGLTLASCLYARQRTIEAWDALRRALVGMPVDEALAHQQEFETLRLAALEQWQQRDPQNEQLRRWLTVYRTTDSADETETLTGEPTPQVKLAADLGAGRQLIGFDYRAEDIETGPFMTVDFYVRDGEHILRQRRTVLNQAPNGSFSWDAVPDGVRPFGWQGYVYDHTPEALSQREVAGEGLWLCLVTQQMKSLFGLQSNPAPVSESASLYLQGGDSYTEQGLVLGRSWQGRSSSSYSYTPGARSAKVVHALTGPWLPPAGTRTVTVWVLSEDGCVRNLYLFTVPML